MYSNATVYTYVHEPPTNYCKHCTCVSMELLLFTPTKRVLLCVFWLIRLKYCEKWTTLHSLCICIYFVGEHTFCLKINSWIFLSFSNARWHKLVQSCSGKNQLLLFLLPVSLVRRLRQSPKNELKMEHEWKQPYKWKTHLWFKCNKASHAWNLYIPLLFIF